ATRVSNRRAITRTSRNSPGSPTIDRLLICRGSASPSCSSTVETCGRPTSRALPNFRNFRKWPMTAISEFSCCLRQLLHPGLDLRLSFAYSAAHVRRDGPMLPLTKRQREILDYLNEFIQQHGYAPSLEEIGRRFGLSSLATVHKHLTNLQEKGFIKRAWNR